MALKPIPDYVPLWCKSNYSFLVGASHAEELIDTAQELGLPALALTDADGVYGIVRAHVAAKSRKIHLIIGSQVSIVDGSSVVLLTKNKRGYSNLCAMLSAGHLRSPKGQAKVTWDEVYKYSDGLIALWNNNGKSYTQVASNLSMLREAYNKDVYAIVTRHLLVEDVQRERETRHYAQAASIPLVAATEVLYHMPERRKLHDVLTCIKHGITLMEAGTLLKANAGYALQNKHEFAALYRDAPELLQSTIHIAQQCQFSLDELEYRYPDESVPEGFTTATWLRKLVIDGGRMRYQGSIPEAVSLQLEKELSIIEQLRYSGYFITMWEIVRFCNAQKILCQGRGSAANSAVCFCLGVTAIDPVRMELLFERFLSLERAEPPDIDLDIEHHRREEVIQYMYQRYGRDRAAMVANVVRYRRRSAIREVGKVFGISDVTLDRTAKLMSHWEDSSSELLKAAGFDMSAPMNRILLERAQEITGFPRHLSIHPGGFLLGSEAVTHIVPIENATMSDRTVIQWDKEDIEALNLFKVDLLGLGALTHLAHCFTLLKRNYGKEISIATIPPDDKPTYAMMQKADTIGVFQIESRAQMSMLPRLKPVNYYDLVIEISLVRPGPISGGMVHPYLARRAGKETVIYPHASLEPVLKKTLGVPLFQEQVMKLAVVVADYSPGEADQLRRDMAAWKSTGRIEEHREKLISRMIKKGIQKEFAQRVFEQIQGFGEYGFPESHAASFALIAYATAYLKYHYPAVFVCALLNAYPMGFYAPSTIIDDAKRHKVLFLPMDVLKSDWDCRLERIPTSNKPAVRVGLRYLNGFGTALWNIIEKVRAKRKLSSLSDFKAFCRLPRDAYEQLAESGALECFGVERRKTLWIVMEEGGQKLQHESPRLLNSDRDTLIPYEEQAPTLKSLHSADLINWDFESSEHSTRGHILEPYRSQLEAEGLPDASGVSKGKNGNKISYAGYVICRQRPSTAEGVLFITLEDETGFVNLVVWNKTFTEYRTLILTNGVLGVTGKLQIEDGVVHVIAESFWIPDIFSISAEIKQRSHDFH